MPKFVALIVAALLWAGPLRLVGDVPTPAANSKVVNYQEIADRLPWKWSDLQASLTYSVTHHLADDELETFTQDGGYRLVIRLKTAGKEVSALAGHGETVFTRWGDRLYLADFSPIASGCTVVAVHLKTGERLWQSRLRGLGPVAHSKYRNRVNIATDGQVVTVWGKEAAGRYVELLDRKTGRTVGHKVYPEER